MEHFKEEHFFSFFFWLIELNIFSIYVFFLLGAHFQKSNLDDYSLDQEAPL